MRAVLLLVWALLSGAELYCERGQEYADYGAALFAADDSLGDAVVLEASTKQLAAVTTWVAVHRARAGGLPVAHYTDPRNLKIANLYRDDVVLQAETESSTVFVLDNAAANRWSPITQSNRSSALCEDTPEPFLNTGAPSGLPPVSFENATLCADPFMVGAVEYHVVVLRYTVRTPGFHAVCFRGGDAVLRLSLARAAASATVAGPVWITTTTAHSLLGPILFEPMIVTLRGPGLSSSGTFGVAEPAPEGAGVAPKCDVPERITLLGGGKAAIGFFDTGVTRRYLYKPGGEKAGVVAFCFESREEEWLNFGHVMNVTVEDSIRMVFRRPVTQTLDFSVVPHRVIIGKPTDIKEWADMYRDATPRPVVILKNQILWIKAHPDSSQPFIERLHLINSTVVIAPEINMSAYPYNVSRLYERELNWDQRFLEERNFVFPTPPEMETVAYWNALKLKNVLNVYDLEVEGGAVLGGFVNVVTKVLLHPNQTLLFHTTLGDDFAYERATLQNYLAQFHSFAVPNDAGYVRKDGGVQGDANPMDSYPCVNEGSISSQSALVIYEGVTLAPLFSTRSAVLGPAVSRHRVLYAGSAKLSEGTSTPYIRSLGSLTFARDASRRVRGAWLGSGGRRVGADVSGLLGEVRVPAGAGQYLDRTVVGRLCGEARRQYEESFFRFYEPFVSVGVGVGEKGGVEADASLVVDTAFTWAGGVGSVSSVGSGQVDVSGTVAVLGDGKVTVEAEVAVSLGHVNTSSDPTAKMTLNLQSGNGTRQGGRLTVYGGRLGAVNVVSQDSVHSVHSFTGLVLGGGRFTLSGEVVVDVEDFALCQVATVLPVSSESMLAFSSATHSMGTVLVDADIAVTLKKFSPKELWLLRGSIEPNPHVSGNVSLLDVYVYSVASEAATVLWNVGVRGFLLKGDADSSTADASRVMGNFSQFTGSTFILSPAEAATEVFTKTAGLRAPAVYVEGADVVLLGGARGVDGCVSVLVLEHVFRLQSTGLAGNVLHVEGCVWFAAATQWEVGAPASTPTPASQDTAEVWFGGGVEHVVSCRGGCRMLAVAVVAVHTEARLSVLAGTELGAGVVEVAVAGLGELSLFEGARVGGDVKVALHGVLRASHADVSGRLALDGELSGPLHQCGGGLVSVGGDLVVGEQASLACDTAVVGEGGGRVDGWAGEVGVSVEVVTWGGALVGEGRLVPRDASCVAPKDFGEMRNTVSGRTLRLSVETATPASPHVYTVAAALLAGVVGVYVVLLPLFLQHGVFGLWAAVVERPPFPLEMETIGMYTWGNALACAHMVYEAVLFASVGFHTGVLWPSGVVGTQHFLTDVLLMQGVRGPVMVITLVISGLCVLWGAAWSLPDDRFTATTSVRSDSNEVEEVSKLRFRSMTVTAHKTTSIVANIFLLQLLLLLFEPLACEYIPAHENARLRAAHDVDCWGSGMGGLISHLAPLMAASLSAVVLVFMTFHVGNNLSMPLSHPPFRQGLDVRHKRVFEAVRVGVIQVQAILLSVLGTAENAGALVWGSFVLQGAYLAFALVSHPCVFKGVNRVRWLLQYSGVAVVGVAAVSTAVHGARTSAQCGAHGGVWMLVVLGVLLAAGVGAFVCTLTPWFQARVAREREAHPRYELYKWAKGRHSHLSQLVKDIRGLVRVGVNGSYHGRNDYLQQRARIVQLRTQLKREQDNVRGWRERFLVPFYLGRDEDFSPKAVPATSGPVSVKQDVLFAESSEVEAVFADFEGWVKGKLLGRGTYGSVYLAVLPAGTLLAVKAIELPEATMERKGDRDDVEVPMLAKEKKMKGKNATMLLKVQQEVDFIRNLKHPNVIEYKACLLDREANTINIFMEYAVGGSLASLVKKCTRRLPEDTVRLYVVQILQGLSFLHAKGIIHRDIKGDNVLLDASGNAKLADFGCAKEMASATRVCGTFAGSPYWMAPEVIRNKGYDAKADIWSVGCTTIETLNEYA